ncbi:ABC transporter permease [bacterium]|nr:ABC transporter permease [bacterium]
MIQMAWENLRIALSSLRTNKLRSALTTLGIIIGITTVIAIISVIEGLNLAFSAELSTIGGNVIYVQKWRWMTNDWDITKKWRDLGWKEYRALRDQVRESDLVIPMHRTMRPVRYEGKKIDDVLVTGAGAGYDELRDATVGSGRYLNAHEFDAGRDVVVIGWDVAEKLFGLRNPVGQDLYIGGKRFAIAGVLEQRGDFFDLNLDTTVVIPIKNFEKNFGSKRSLTLALRPVNPDDAQPAIDEIRAILRRVRGVAFREDDDFAINKVDAIKELYDKLTGGLYAAMFGVASISLLVGGVGIMNIMLVSVTERTREIGIRKAVGARRSSILLQFLIEAVLLACLGGAIGVSLGFGLANLVNAVSPVPATVRLWSVWLGLGFSALVGIVFGFFPAWRAASRHPIEALRWE